MKGSGGNPRDYPGFIQEWAPADVGFNNTAVPTVATNGQPLDVLPFGTFCLFLLTTGNITVSVQSGDIDVATVFATGVLSAATGGAGTFVFPFGGSAPLLTGWLFRSARVVLQAVGAGCNATCVLLGRV